MHGAGYVRGETHLNAVIDDRTVQEIRDEYQHGVRGRGTPALAKKYGISRTHVQSIVNGRSRVAASV